MIKKLILIFLLFILLFPLNQFYKISKNSLELKEKMQQTKIIEAKEQNNFDEEVIILKLQIGNNIMYVNDKPVEIDVAPIIIEGRTLLPIRWIAEPLGASVSWDEKEKKVNISLNDIIIELWIGKNLGKINGNFKLIDPNNPKVVPQIINGRTMLPVRFVSENLGCEVQWENDTKVIKIIYKILINKKIYSFSIKAEEGGVIDIPNILKINIDQNTLNNDTDFKVEVIDKNLFKEYKNKIVSKVVNITLNSNNENNLKDFVELIFYIDKREDIKQENLFIGYWNEKKSTWEKIGGIVYWDQYIIKTYVDHFSIFGVLFGEKKPLTLKDQYDKGKEFFNKKEYKLAIKEFQKVLNDYEEKTDEDHKLKQYSKLYIARCYINLHDVENAYKWYTKTYYERNLNYNFENYQKYESATTLAINDLSYYFPMGYETLLYLNSIKFFDGMEENKLPDAYLKGYENGINFDRFYNINELPIEIKSYILNYIEQQKFDAGINSIDKMIKYVFTSSQVNAQENEHKILMFWKYINLIFSFIIDSPKNLYEGLKLIIKMSLQKFFNILEDKVIDSDPLLDCNVEKVILYKVFFGSMESSIETFLGINDSGELIVKGGENLIDYLIKKEEEYLKNKGFNLYDLDLGINPYNIYLGDKSKKGTRVSRNPAFAIWVILEGEAESGKSHKKSTLGFYLKSNVSKNIAIKQNSYWSWNSWFKENEIVENKGWEKYYEKLEIFERIEKSESYNNFLPDLKIISIDYYPKKPLEDDNVTINIKISNQGNRKICNEFKISLLIDDSIYEIKTIEGNLYPKDVLEIEFKPFKLGYKCKNIKIILDNENLIKESNENNNELTTQICSESKKPDLIVDSISYSPSQPKEGDNVTITAKIKNQGEANANNFYTTLEIDGIKHDTKSISSLSPGSYILLTFKSWKAKAGCVNLRVFVDSNYNVEESNENNNELRNEICSISNICGNPYEIKIRGYLKGKIEDFCLNGKKINRYLMQGKEIISGNLPKVCDFGDFYDLEVLIPGCCDIIGNIGNFDDYDYVEVYGYLVNLKDNDFYTNYPLTTNNKKCPYECVIAVCGCEKYYIKKISETIQLSVDIWVDKGCGSTYYVNESGKVFFKANLNSYIEIYWSTNGSQPELITKGDIEANKTYYFNFSIIPPVGTEVVTIKATSGNMKAEKSCTFYSKEMSNNDGCIALFNFEEGEGTITRDEFSGYIGRLYGKVSFDSFNKIHDNYSLKFGGSPSDYVETNITIPEGNFYFEAWIYPTDLSGDSTYRPIVTNWTSSKGTLWFGLIGNRLYLQLDDWGYAGYNFDIFIQTNVWNKVAFYYQSGLVEIYLNDQKVYSKTDTPLISSSKPLKFGAYQYGCLSCGFKGNMDIILICRNKPTTILVKKPNIYLYPIESQIISVKINTSYLITNSDPPYNKDGWNVLVNNDGKIENIYDYLFYEVKIQNIWNRNVEYGWIIEKEKFYDEVYQMMNNIGFNDKEISDFINYWSRNLPYSKYYLFTILDENLINKLVKLEINPKPDIIRRIWFGVKLIDKRIDINKPKINPLKREGFTVIEWGLFFIDEYNNEKFIKNRNIRYK